ncbi:hypothetical protein AAC387_Pa01g2308 [Persea americana]
MLLLAPHQLYKINLNSDSSAWLLSGKMQENRRLHLSRLEWLLFNQLSYEVISKILMFKLQELAAQLTDIWNLMDTPMEDRNLFKHVTCNISASVDDVTIPGALALELFVQAEVEVEKLDQLKGSKMKEIALKKQTKLEDFYARAHVEINFEAA